MSLRGPEWDAKWREMKGEIKHTIAYRYKNGKLVGTDHTIDLPRERYGFPQFQEIREVMSEASSRGAPERALMYVNASDRVIRVTWDEVA